MGGTNISECNSQVTCILTPTFKMKIHNLLFLNLQNQDSYADIDNLIYEMKKTPS